MSDHCLNEDEVDAVMRRNQALEKQLAALRVKVAEVVANLRVSSRVLDWFTPEEIHEANGWRQAADLVAEKLGDVMPAPLTVDLGEFRRFRVIETDNYGRDYPDESFHGPACANEDDAQTLANMLNKMNVDQARYYRVVKLPYTLEKGFEP